MRRVLPLVIVALSSGCGGNTPSGPAATVETLELRLQTAHFRMLAAATTPGSVVQGVADHLEGDYDRILIELRVGAHPVTTVRIWQDETAYFNELTNHFGVRYQANGYITGPSELRLLATSNVNVNAVHELVHAVSLTLNPRFANNPRWL